MHHEAQRLVVSNNKLISDLKLYITKLDSTQSELDKLKHENEKLVSTYKAIGCVCASTSLNMDDYKGKSDLTHLLSAQKHTIDKIGFWV